MLAQRVRNGVLLIECVRMANHCPIGGSRRVFNAFALVLQLKNPIPGIYGETVASGAFKRGLRMFLASCIVFIRW